MSLDSSKRVSMGAALQCDHLKSLWPHQRARAVGWEKAIRSGGVGVHAKEVTVAAAVIQPNSSASKAGEARSKWLLPVVCKAAGKERWKVSLCSKALAKGRDVQAK